MVRIVTIVFFIIIISISVTVVFYAIRRVNKKHSSSSMIENPKAEERIKQETEIKMFEFFYEVDKDIADTFGISLGKYEKIDDKELFDRQNDIWSKTLLDVFMGIILVQSYGDIKPSIYIHEGKKAGCIFEKKADGTNYSYIIEYDKEWKVVRTDKKAGKVMKFIDQGNKEQSVNCNPQQ